MPVTRVSYHISRGGIFIAALRSKRGERILGKEARQEAQRQGPRQPLDLGDARSTFSVAQILLYTFFGIAPGEGDPEMLLSQAVRQPPIRARYRVPISGDVGVRRKHATEMQHPAPRKHG
jgi:hypothetical protein